MARPEKRYARLALATEVFTPGSPIDRLELFSGRIEELSDVLAVLNQRGQHVAMFGERGVGKTSIASILAEATSQRPNGTRPLGTRIGCTTNDTYESIWRNLLRNLDLEAPKELLTPETIRRLLATVDEKMLIVIDELDRLGDDESLSVLADTIKLLSDQPVNATLVIVGVADTIDQLIGDHKSIGRALREVQIPRMSSRELQGIVEKGMNRLEMAISDKLKAKIATLSEGLPHYTHAMSLYASQRAIEDDRDEINDRDVNSAIDRTVDKSQHSILSTYRKATRSARTDVLYDRVLLACALAKKDELGMFAARHVVQPLSLIMGKPYQIPSFARHLRKFAEHERGFVLQRHGEERRYFYRFDEPMMQVFVILDGLAKGLITESELAKIRSEVTA